MTRASKKAKQFTESVIHDMARQATQHHPVNLVRGLPDFPAPEVLKRAAQKAVASDMKQYATTWGAQNLCHTIARKFVDWQRIEIDLGREAIVC